MAYVQFEEENFSAAGDPPLESVNFFGMGLAPLMELADRRGDSLGLGPLGELAVGVGGRFFLQNGEASIPANSCGLIHLPGYGKQ